jgi:predicted phosphodiesterase
MFRGVVAVSNTNSLIVVIGDIHGRFHRVREWIAALESARGRAASLVLSVGDIEAFVAADDQRRKAAKRAMPAEFADYVSGRCSFERPLYFIGGNNEDFEALHPLHNGGPIAPQMHYLGRYGERTLNQLKVAYLSGIYAPRYVDKPLLLPVTPEGCRQAGYFRTTEINALAALSKMPEIMLAHEWPRGLAARPGAVARGVFRELRAYQTPWIGNGATRGLVETIRPKWLFCGHSHVAFAGVIAHEKGQTNVACLDQAGRSDGAVFWLEYAGSKAVSAGWGTSGTECWRANEIWDERRTPNCGLAEKGSGINRRRQEHDGSAADASGVHPTRAALEREETNAAESVMDLADAVASGQRG